MSITEGADTRAIPPEFAIDAAGVAAAIETFISERTLAHRRDGAVLGLSGGLDSAVVATLAARALGPRKVLALILPDRDSAPESARDARELASQLGIRVEIVDLTRALDALGVYQRLPLHLLGPRALQSAAVRAFYSLASHWPELRPFRLFVAGPGRSAGIVGQLVAAGKAYVSVKHRLRMACWYHRAEAENLLALGACNRTEKQIGLFVRYGDSAADVAPIEGLYKTQVFQLGRFLGVPRAILEKPPSPDLLPGITDEYVLGMGYEVLDRILCRLERGMPLGAIARELGLSRDRADYVAELREAARALREQPEVGPRPGP